MKLPVSVIADALAKIGNWTYTGKDYEAEYRFPHQFDGTVDLPGHVLVISEEQLSGKIFQGDGLVVFSAGSRPPASVTCPCLCSEESVVPDIILRLLTRLYDRMDAWEEELASCGSDMAGIQRMLEITAKYMKGELGLIDVSYHMPACTQGMAEGLGITSSGNGQRPDDINIASLAEDPQITAVRSVRGVRVYENAVGNGPQGESLFRNLFRPGEDIYYNRLLFVRDTYIYTDTDRFMLERLAARIERITLYLSTYALPASEYAAFRQIILRSAEPAYRHEAAVSAALAPLGWEDADSYRFYIFRYIYPERDAGITEYMLRHIESMLPASCGAVRGEQILLVQNVTRGRKDIEGFRAQLAEFLRENMYKAGISGLVRSFSRLRGAFLQAEAAAELGPVRDPMFWYYQFENYRQDYLIRKSSEDIPPELLMMPAVTELLQWDADKGTSYTETLQTFAEENFNVSRTAQKLYIHRTSLQDRLNRIRELSGLDLDDPEIRFDLLFSFRLREQCGEGKGHRP